MEVGFYQQEVWNMLRALEQGQGNWSRAQAWGRMKEHSCDCNS